MFKKASYYLGSETTTRTNEKEIDRFMPMMADPMIALLSLQKVLNSGPPVDPRELDEGYAKMYDEPNGGKRYSYAKIIEGEVQAVSIFGLEDPIDGVDCYSVGHAVNENHRGRGLAVEAVDKGVEELKNKFRQTSMGRFYLEAVIDVTNIHSIKVAEKLFSDSPEKIIEKYSGKPALHFKKLIALD
ncbi:MAG: GNAT family N-acetyltransferase [Pseudobdellovibrionaceae bacterium]